MTVGVGYKTDKYFVCFTDIQVFDEETSLNSNSSRKMLLLRFGKHHGVIYASGHGDVTDAVFIMAATLAKKYHAATKLTIESFVENLTPALCQYHQKREEQIIKREKNRITTEQKIFDTAREQKAYAAQRFEEIMKKIKKDREETDSSFKLAFYDGINNRPRVFSIEDSLKTDQTHLCETFQATTAIGVGDDNASVYFSLYGRELISNKLKLPDLFAITAGAYNYATQIQGVEGTPQICVIDNNSARILPHEESAILANASAAHIEELLSLKNERTYASKVYQSIRQSKQQRQKTIEQIVSSFIKATGLRIDISLAAIKLAAWGEIANKKLFPTDQS